MYRFGMLFMELRGSRGLTREEAEDALGLRQGNCRMKRRWRISADTLALISVF